MEHSQQEKDGLGRHIIWADVLSHKTRLIKERRNGKKKIGKVRRASSGGFRGGRRERFDINGTRGRGIKLPRGGERKRIVGETVRILSRINELPQE